MATVCGQNSISSGDHILTGYNFFQTIGITFIISVGFIATRTVYDHIRQHYSHLTVLVIGAGPIGLLSAVIAAQSHKVSRIILCEEQSRHELFKRPQQIMLTPKSVSFLQQLGVDCNSMEGCWQDNCFLTKIGIFQEYLLDLLSTLPAVIEIHLGQKFSRENLKALDMIPERLLAIVCDGSRGHSSTLLGLSDEFSQQSCKAYGAVAALDGNGSSSIPAPEIRVHNLTFDLNAYGNDADVDQGPQGFHLKIFGSIGNRYMSLAVNKCESRLVKALKVSLDQSVMRNIFQVCFNTYKCSNESPISDKQALRHMKFSPRLFEIKIYQRLENVVYVEDGDVFVVTEGDAARYSNFHTGMDINVGISGLKTLNKFIHLAATANSEKKILTALQLKFNHHKTICTAQIKNGLKETMLT